MLSCCSISQSPSVRTIGLIYQRSMYIQYIHWHVKTVPISICTSLPQWLHHKQNQPMKFYSLVDSNCHLPIIKSYSLFHLVVTPPLRLNILISAANVGIVTAANVTSCLWLALSWEYNSSAVATIPLSCSICTEGWQLSSQNKLSSRSNDLFNSFDSYSVQLLSM